MASRSAGRRAVASDLGLIEPGSRRRKLPSDRTILARVLLRAGRIIGKLALVFVVGSIGLVLLYRFVPPPVTPLMLIRPIEKLGAGDWVSIDKSWMSIDRIDHDLLKAVIASEDARFFSHGGIDWDAVEAARQYNLKHEGKKFRGASTITMQTARNAFLWQGRNYIRKGLEVWFTYLIELLWGKERILEIYVNVIEWGDGIYGVDAAARHYFDRGADDLTPRQAALLASVLPNPRRWSPAEPTSYINERVSSIRAGMRVVSLPDGFASAAQPQ